MSGGERPIRTPFSRLLLLWRQRYLPVAIWGIAVIATAALFQRQPVYVNAIGLAEAPTTFVAPLLDGTVQSIAVDVLDVVEAGQVVGLMDDSLIRAELAVAEALLDQSRATLEAERLRLENEHQLQQASLQSDQRRFLVNEEQARLDHLDRQVRHETDKVELERLGVQLKRQEAMKAQRILDDAAYDETRLAHEALRTKIEKDKEAIALAEAHRKTAERRREELVPVDGGAAAAGALLEALRAEISAQEAAVREVQSRRQALVLRAPVRGRVATITRRPGESMLAGDPIMTIVGDTATRVMAYVNERMAPAAGFREGDTVELHSRTQPKVMARGTILKVGSHIEPYPLRLLTNPLVPQHGLQVLVGDIPENVFRPGEALDVRLRAAT